MEVYIAADHNGFGMKEQLVPWLTEQGHTVHDLGPDEHNPHDDYPDFAFLVAEAVAEDASHRTGILICGSGAGMAIAADKVTGIRAALIHDPHIAEAARRDDDVNVLALGADFITFDDAKQIVETWLTTSYANLERYQRRLDKIRAYEQHH